MSSTGTSFGFGSARGGESTFRDHPSGSEWERLLFRQLSIGHDSDLAASAADFQSNREKERERERG
jgi:hypothetical protein